MSSVLKVIFVILSAVIKFSLVFMIIVLKEIVLFPLRLQRY